MSTVRVNIVEFSCPAPVMVLLRCSVQVFLQYEYKSFLKWFLPFLCSGLDCLVTVSQLIDIRYLSNRLNSGNLNGSHVCSRCQLVLQGLL